MIRGLLPPRRMQEDKVRMDHEAKDEVDRRRMKAEQDRKDREFQEELKRREADRKRMKEEMIEETVRRGRLLL